MNVSEIKNEHILDPYEHFQAVTQFNSFFNLELKKPGVSSLTEILAAFTNLPYENISKIIQLNAYFVSPDHIRMPEKIMEDYIRYRLGGTCFSLTFFLQSILSIRGFQCYPVMADMKYRRNVHCALVVLLDSKKFLVDPGYILNQPMEIHPDKPRLYRSAHTGIELQFDRDSEIYHLFTFDKNEKKWRYRFQDIPTSLSEFLKHWLDSFYWPGMHGICLTKVQNNGLVYVHNDFLQISTVDGKQKMRLKKNLHATIQDMFGISAELVEQALATIPQNMELEKKLELDFKIKNPGHESQ
jgi:N-hydroxyarylamine O-acetyltransferase